MAKRNRNPKPRDPKPHDRKPHEDTPPRQPPRIQVALYSVLLLAAAATLSFVDTAKTRATPDAASSADARFAELRSALPPEVRKIGYLGDIEIGANPSAYYLAQYALAPVIVESDSNRDLVAGNFVRPDLAPSLIAARGLKVVRDFGGGVLLLAREKQ